MFRPRNFFEISTTTVYFQRGTTLPKLAFEKLASDLNYDLAKIIKKYILNYYFQYTLEKGIHKSNEFRYQNLF